jgi:glycogen(starch) synthase
MSKAKAQMCFEISWEVANKVGGIYTVIKSKAAHMQSKYKDYFLVGPYFFGISELDVQIDIPPEPLHTIFQQLEDEHIHCYYGTWQIKGEPKVILVDTKDIIGVKNEWKKMWWEWYQIDSLRTGWDFEEPMLWATAIGKLLEKIEQYNADRRIVMQAHEWMAGFALLWLEHQHSTIGTVFTTHATMLGRTLASHGQPVHEMLETLNPHEEAYRYNIEAKFLMEKACAQASDVFTTVSTSTAEEAEKILGRKPEVVLMNGLDVEKFPTIEDLSLIHVRSREIIREFLTFYFFPYYTFDLEHNLNFFFVGRNEVHNKGIDICIRALGKLNETLKKNNAKRTVTVFFWVPRDTGGMRRDLLESQNYYRHISNYVRWSSDQILKNITGTLMSRKRLTSSEIFSRDFQLAIKKDMWKFKREGNPPLCTHYLPNEEQDEIIRLLRAAGLDNKEDDHVKVIYYPIYLDGHDGLLNLGYYEAMAGCHLGLFPSYYEPWGYTPIEAAAMGVMSITSDLAGCGLYLYPSINERQNPGMWVLTRRGATDEQSTERLYDLMQDYVKLTHQQRVQRKVAAKEMSKLVDWRELVENYIEAHNLAIDKALQRIV